MELAASDTAILHREIEQAVDSLTAARDTSDALEALVEMTSVLDILTATQHELVNALLDRGATWSQVADALSTSSIGARRRFPRRQARQGSADDTDAPEALA
ncbi:hypothetical protein acdb102_21300 [Acidothermaceae bacterium B102]|nr:hypothetical protein acdb102_21300 [Acidothermaceae bacterium B102]